MNFDATANAYGTVGLEMLFSGYWEGSSTQFNLAKIAALANWGSPAHAYGGDLAFYTKLNNDASGNTGMTERMRILHNGNVGINDSSPDFLLDVEGLIGFKGAAMSSSEDLFLKSIAAFYAATLGGPPVYYYWNDGAGQSCTTKCSNMGHTCAYGFAVHQSYISMPTCNYDATAGLACLCT